MNFPPEFPKLFIEVSGQAHLVYQRPGDLRQELPIRPAERRLNAF